MPASYPSQARALNPQNTANDGDVWPNPNLAQAADYNLLDEEVKAIADDLRSRFPVGTNSVTVLTGTGAPAATINTPIPTIYVDASTSEVYTMTDASADANVFEKMVRSAELGVQPISGAGVPGASVNVAMPAFYIDNTTGLVYTLTDATVDANVWAQLATV